MENEILINGMTTLGSIRRVCRLAEKNGTGCNLCKFRPQCQLRPANWTFSEGKTYRQDMLSKFPAISGDYVYELCVSHFYGGTCPERSGKGQFVSCRACWERDMQ